MSGQFIHKELELVLKPEEVRIAISSEEEQWALRYVSSLVSEFLLISQQAHELPCVASLSPP
jgi:hypothetical protein